ncbi:MAG: hypothetical protein RL023_528 [Candidatus Parcubacteria bacterium]
MVEKLPSGLVIIHEIRFDEKISVGGKAPNSVDFDPEKGIHIDPSLDGKITVSPLDHGKTTIKDAAGITLMDIDISDASATVEVKADMKLRGYTVLPDVLEVDGVEYFVKIQHINGKTEMWIEPIVDMYSIEPQLQFSAAADIDSEDQKWFDVLASHYQNTRLHFDPQLNVLKMHGFNNTLLTTTRMPDLLIDHEIWLQIKD